MNADTAAITRDRQKLVLMFLEAGWSLRAICRDPVMPAAGTVCGWVRKSAGFARRYRAAKRKGATKC